MKPLKAKLSVRIVLSTNSVAKLKLPVNGRGGFQSLLRSLQASIVDENELVLTPKLVGRVARYVHKYGSGGFQGRLGSVLSQLQDLAKVLEPIAA